MDASPQPHFIPHYYFFRQQLICPSAFSFKSCCCFLLVILLFALTVVGAAALAVIFILKPREPLFSLQKLMVDSYELEAYDSGSTLYVSSVVSLSLNAENPNKVGIKYRPTRLMILYGGFPMGVIRVPGFYQPAHSANVSVQARVLMQCVNASQLLSGVDLLHGHSRRSNDQIRVLGDITVHVRVFRITLPKIKIALDCDINVDYKEFSLITEAYESMKVIQNHMASFPANFQTFSKKCSFALYI
ncbi:uncharacterized protein LOC131166556 [Malania oleifera]|uniref:uncharacterized protein LOC131166556 n=1 Tax=Malania oleifera TaxID=397392 RepID=UPI0025AE2517|nr:uncharacterized protein LOC131166556 [Malania oleifera]